jgi:Arylsulfotransferase (ASST)
VQTGRTGRTIRPHRRRRRLWKPSAAGSLAADFHEIALRREDRAGAMRRVIPAVALIFLVALGAYFAGMWTTYKNWQPWQTTEEVRKLWRSWRATGQFLRDGTYQRRLDYAADQPYMVYDAAAMARGHVLINRFHPTEQRFVTDLYDSEGKIIHSWPVDYSRLVEGGSPVEFAHIATALPDGSLMVDFDQGTAMARLDACGDTIWKKTDQVYHHSIERADDGFWTWAEPKWEGGQDQSMVRFDAETGETLESIGIIDEVVAKSRPSALALTIPEGFEFDRQADPNRTDDIFHPNDIEALTAAMAPAFPQFKAGDLLVSLRNINVVAVIDRQTHAVKWAQHGPWRDQHDADFQSDGTITVFSNNIDRFRSTIISVDPKTNAARDLFLGTGVDFDSFIMGKHQRLPNGNWLIASPTEGRVLEVTAAGKMVREWNNILDQNYNSVITYAEFLPEGYFATLPACAK